MEIKTNPFPMLGEPYTYRKSIETTFSGHRISISKSSLTIFLKCSSIGSRSSTSFVQVSGQRNSSAKLVLDCVMSRINSVAVSSAAHRGWTDCAITKFCL